MTNVSQERLNNEQINQIADVMNDLHKGGFITDQTHRQIEDLIVSHLAVNAERDRYKAAYEKCAIGGNSLASTIIGWDLPQEFHDWTYEQASKYFYKNRYLLDPDIAYEKYETWLCWKSIREAGEVVEGGSSNV